MPVLISLLRGVNLGPHKRVRMEALRTVYESLGLKDVRTYLQSGNVLFRSQQLNPGHLVKTIETAVERQFRFRSAIVLRTVGELRKVVEANPFAKRRDVEPNKLLVTFLAREPEPAAGTKVRAIQADPEEIHLRGREVYIYYPNGLARPKLPWTAFEKMLQVSGTGRNWNTVTQLLKIAEEMEKSG